MLRPLLALVLLALAVVPATASAGSYTVWSCRGPDGSPASAAAWTPEVSSEGSVPLGSTTDTCAAGGALTASLTERAAGRSDPYDVAGFRLALPPGASIAGYSVELAAQTRGTATGGYGAGLAFGEVGVGGIEAGCPEAQAACSFGVAGTPLAPANLVAASRSARAVTLAVRCDATLADPGPACVPATSSTAPLGTVRLFRSALDLADASAPEVGTPSGSLVDPAGSDGTGSVEADVSDVGGGVARTALIMDGTEIAHRDPTGSCVEPYTLPAPCPGTVRAVYVIAQPLPPGDHSFAIRASDAAGQSTEGPEVTATVHPPASTTSTVTETTPAPPPVTTTVTQTTPAPPPVTETAPAPPPVTTTVTTTAPAPPPVTETAPAPPPVTNTAPAPPPVTTTVTTTTPTLAAPATSTSPAATAASTTGALADAAAPATTVAGTAPMVPAALVATAGRVRVAAGAQVRGAVRTAAGAGLADVPIVVGERAVGAVDDPFVPVGVVRTDADGGFALPAGTTSRQLRLVVADPAVAAAPIDVLVLAPLRLALDGPDATLRNGQLLTLRGTLRGAGAAAGGQDVLVQAIVDGDWRTVGDADVADDGAIAWRHRLRRTRIASTYRFRIVAAAQPRIGWARAVSPVVAVRVRP